MPTVDKIDVNMFGDIRITCSELNRTFDIQDSNVKYQIFNPNDFSFRNSCNYWEYNYGNLEVNRVYRLKVKKDGAFELVEAVRTNVIGASTAAKLCTLPIKEQIELVEKGKAAMIAKFKELAPRKSKPKPEEKEDEPEVKKDIEVTPKVSWAMDYAEMAISQLKRIEKNDPLRVPALKQVISWAKKQTKI